MGGVHVFQECLPMSSTKTYPKVTTFRKGAVMATLWLLLYLGGALESLSSPSFVRGLAFPLEQKMGLRPPPSRGSSQHDCQHHLIPYGVVLTDVPGTTRAEAGPHGPSAPPWAPGLYPVGHPMATTCHLRSTLRPTEPHSVRF